MSRRRRSYKVWLVCEEGHEHCVPRGAYTLWGDALAARDRVQGELDARPAGMVPAWGTAQQINLVVHDGANALLMDLAHAVGKNSHPKRGKKT